MYQTRNFSLYNTSWNAPYTFSGKDKDVETGYGYLSTRYYDSGLSVWLSVDPLSDKYPTLSPYTYCANNPIMLVDPDGRQIIEGALIVSFFKQYTKLAISTRKMQLAILNYMVPTFFNSCKKIERKMAKINGEIEEFDKAIQEVEQLETSKVLYSISYGGEAKGKTYYEDGVVKMQIKDVGDIASIAHELKHGYQFDTKTISFQSDGIRPGSLTDFYDEREAYDRDYLYGGEKMFDSDIEQRYGLPNKRRILGYGQFSKSNLEENGELFNKFD